MDKIWYYADAQQQQQGPVAADWFAAALGRGLVNGNSLVWREGLPGWAPLSQFAAELGLAITAPPPLPRSAPIVVKPSGGSNTWVAVVVVLVVGGFFMLIILAAIALPAYQDYTIRAKVSEALVRGGALKPAVEEFVAAEGRCPDNDDSGFKPATSYADARITEINIGELQAGGCAIQLLLKDLGTKDTAGKEILYARDDGGEWTVTSTVPNKFLPAALRSR